MSPSASSPPATPPVKMTHLVQNIYNVWISVTFLRPFQDLILSFYLEACLGYTAIIVFSGYLADQHRGMGGGGQDGCSPP